MNRFNNMLGYEVQRSLLQMEEIIKGATNAETSAARVDRNNRNHPTLKDNIDVNMFEMDDKFEDVNMQMALKASQVYVDMMISNSLSGSPKEGFFSLSELYDKYPDGAPGPMLVFDSEIMDRGHIFLWDDQENEWVDWGPYQPQPLAEFLMEDGQPWEGSE